MACFRGYGYPIMAGIKDISGRHQGWVEEIRQSS
jgi:hypothetical protein